GAAVAGGGISNGFFFLTPPPAQPSATSSQGAQTLAQALGLTTAGSQSSQTQGNAAPITLTINGSMVSGNTASASGLDEELLGGGIASVELSTSIANSTVSGNTLTALGSPNGAESVGGGIASEAPLTASNVTVAGNTVHGATNGESLAGGGGML